jgi:hypothetical protein
MRVIGVDYGINDYLLLIDQNNKKHRVKIRYTLKGVAFVKVYGLRYLLSGFMRDCV